MSEINEGEAIMSAITKALKRNNPEKGLYPEDLYLINHLTRAAKIFQEKEMESFSKDLWGVRVEGVVPKSPGEFRIDFTYTLNLSQMEKDLRNLISKTDTFYLRCMGTEIVHSPDKNTVQLDGDDMEDGKPYKIEFEAPKTFQCIWRR